MESCNHIYGNTKNPYDKTRTSGGSSGGEAVLVSIKTCNAGIGTDIAGSLRIPSFFCGIYSFLITPRRIMRGTSCLSFENTDFFRTTGDPGFIIEPTLGPMTCNFEETAYLTKIIIDFCKIEKTIPPIPWRTDVSKIKKVGVLKEFDFFELTRTNRRATQEAIQILNSKGIETFEIDINKYAEILTITVYACYLKNKVLMNVVNKKINIGETLPPAFDSFVKASKIPKFILPFIARFWRIKKQKMFLDGTVMANTFNQAYLATKILEFKKEFVDQMRALDVETFLCPGLPPATILDKSADINPWVIYTSIWNAFGFCGGSVPMTTVHEDEQMYESKFDEPFERQIKETMKNSKGLPVGVQIIGMAYKDEEVMEVIKVLANEIKNK